ncbi:MAG TPA: tetratricopeptide repeat protein [Thermoanaerobaculia bacterium]|jgi:tetratricopeptide (TPR) repeat protein|nr:tetratricopeptide repeat protein [Thermoanaerobaculia bacterium]
MAGTRDRIVQSAEKNLSRGRLDQALSDYLQLLKDHPKDTFALNKAGDLCVRMGKPADAIEHFARIAELYTNDGFFLKAIAIYKKINKIDPTRLDVYDRLAELYARQGLTQDARSHYAVLAEQWLKKNDLKGAIAAFSKIAALDPADLKIQTRLADLHRVAGQTDQAVARYDAIGGILQRRGAHEDAITFFRKALELDPNDSGSRMQMIRSHLAVNDPAAAVAALETAPRNAETRLLLAEALLAAGDRAAATAAAEDAVAVEPNDEAARSFLFRIRLDDGDPDRALETIAPAVDAAMAAGDFGLAAAHLRPILVARPDHPATLERMTEIREAGGAPAESLAVRLSLAREAEGRGDLAAAGELYRRILSAHPAHPEALARLREIAPVPPPAPETSPAPDVERTDEVQAALDEAEVLARYGLKDRAVERLRALTKRHPDVLSARERLVELLVELENPAAPKETDALAQAYRRQGRESLAVALYARLGLSAEPRRPEPPPPGSPARPSAEVVFDEFEIELPAPPAQPAAEPAGFDSFAGMTEAAPSPMAARGTAGESPAGPRLTPHAPSDAGFGLMAPELGSLIEEKMQRAAAEEPRRDRPAAKRPAVDDENLFADEQQFFNLAEELEKELAEEAAARPSAPDLAGTQDEASLQDIFREFRKGVEQQLSAEDYETHYNLGIAYKEMGLLDEAIGEFQLSSKASALTIECCSLLGLCFLEKGMPQLAIKWYGKGLAAPGIRESETAGLLYDLARVYQDTGDVNQAYKTFLEVYGINTNYRDVVERVRHLEEAKKNMRESVH